ncbi:hypothetical protein [Caulobacter vibrioides]|uniref:hypothetical protein n=1 Tax=Caulobacter vibrioides TaxID=155892 RepID=UPI000BB4F292|nr:hypothetical protein [Caulobacter vibrioides]ATC25184.1 hypothetical protein CA608_11930 [Caulobacter vibrioides]PLR13955.1 hypothetical protein CVUC_05235 [Caulobacter vibrioides]
MPPLNATPHELLAYLKDKATRYAAIARQHIAQAEVFKAGTDQIRPNLVQASRYEQAAREALQLAQQYTDYGTWISMLRPLDQVQRGDMVLIPATFIRRASEEDFPDEGFIQIPGVELPIRLPLHPAQVA